MIKQISWSGFRFPYASLSSDYNNFNRVQYNVKLQRHRNYTSVRRIENISLVRQRFRKTLFTFLIKVCFLRFCNFTVAEIRASLVIITGLQSPGT